MSTTPDATQRNKGKNRVAYIYTTVTCLSLAVFGVLHIALEGNQLLGILELLDAFAVLLILVGMRVAKNIRFQSHLLLLCILTIMFVLLITGGTANTGIFWFFMFPVSAFFLTGGKGGMAWTLALFALVAAVTALQHFGILHTPYPFIALRQLFVSLLVITIGVYAYQRSRDDMALATRQSQQASVEEKLKAETIIENIDEGVIALNAAGEVILANRVAENMLGWRPGELTGKKFTATVPMVDDAGNEIPLKQRPMYQALTHGVPNHITAMYVRKDGGKLPSFITSRAIVVDNKVHGAIETFRDITQEQAIDRAKSEFVTLASHQLRTPISAIAWVSELLLHGDAGTLKPEQADYIQQIYHSNKRMAALVDAMLTTSSLELGSLQVRPQPVDLPDLSRQVLEQQLDTLPADKIIHVKENYAPDLGTVLHDQYMIKTILHNLIANALKYTPSKGTVTVTIKRSSQRLEGVPQKAILIQVADTGMGIPEGQQSKIFTKLFRADNIKHKDTDGTGLGLYIVKTIANYVGGSIRFESEENKGSTFSVWLPATMNARGDAGITESTEKQRGDT